MQEYVSDSGGFYLRDGRWGQVRGGANVRVFGSGSGQVSIGNIAEPPLF